LPRRVSPPAPNPIDRAAHTGTVLDHAEIVRLYGPWTLHAPRDAADFLRDYRGRWWIAGGWAIDAFTGTSREHGDLDIGIPRVDAEEFIRFASRTLDVWAAHGSLTPLSPGGAGVPGDCGNLWLRSGGAEPWDYDVLLDDVRGQTWFYKRGYGVSLPFDQCLWSRDGIDYLRPEIQLLLKAKHNRPKDTYDFERCLPNLDERGRNWLARSLSRESPQHPWLATLSARGA
jgi:hypothetical protein